MRCSFFYTINSVAKPRKATNPTTSVTVVRSTPADRAGSEPNFFSSRGMATASRFSLNRVRFAHFSGKWNPVSAF